VWIGHVFALSILGSGRCASGRLPDLRSWTKLGDLTAAPAPHWSVSRPRGRTSREWYFKGTIVHRSGYASANDPSSFDEDAALDSVASHSAVAFRPRFRVSASWRLRCLAGRCRSLVGHWCRGRHQVQGFGRCGLASSVERGSLVAELRSGIPGYRAVADPRQCNSCRKSMNVCCVTCGVEVLIHSKHSALTCRRLRYRRDADALVLVFAGWGSPH